MTCEAIWYVCEKETERQSLFTDKFISNHFVKIADWSQHIKIENWISLNWELISLADLVNRLKWLGRAICSLIRYHDHEFSQKRCMES